MNAHEYGDSQIYNRSAVNSQKNRRIFKNLDEKRMSLQNGNLFQINALELSLPNKHFNVQKLNKF